MNLLTQMNEAGTTIAMVTHSPADAEYSQRVIHLFDGHIVTENFIQSHYIHSDKSAAEPVTEAEAPTETDAPTETETDA